MYDATEHLDPEIRLEKASRSLWTSRRTSSTPQALDPNSPGAHHPRPPDIALDIKVAIPTGTATERAVVSEYSGEYAGHGQSKTAFKLHCQGEAFDGAILKVTKSLDDPEPFVFK